MSDLGLPDSHRTLAVASWRESEAHELHSPHCMNTVEQQVTTRIQRDELLRLLNTMTPTEQQTVTTRSRISEIQAAAASEKPNRPFSQVAALLTQPRLPRPALVRAKTQPPESRPTLSSQVVAELTPEEIAMLPVEIRPEARDAIEMPPSPTGDVIDIHSEMDKDLGHSIHLSARVPAALRSRLPMIATTLAALVLIVLCGAFFLI
jgi:hypothetical protein